MVQKYQPGAYDFPRPGEPIHDLFLLTSDPGEVGLVLRNLEVAVRRLDRSQLPYRLFGRNSNTALGCFLRISGLPPERLEPFWRDHLLRLRLPGIAQHLWSTRDRLAVAECRASGS